MENINLSEEHPLSAEVIGVLILQELKCIRMDMKEEVGRLRDELIAAVVNKNKSTSTFQTMDHEGAGTSTMMNAFCEKLDQEDGVPDQNEISENNFNFGSEVNGPGIDKLLYLKTNAIETDQCSNNFTRELDSHFIKNESEPLISSSAYPIKSNFGNVNFPTLKRPLKMLVKKWRCKFCQKSFSACSALKKHTMNVHYIKESYSCSMCGKKFDRLFNLNRHTCSTEETVHGSDFVDGIDCPKSSNVSPETSLEKAFSFAIPVLSNIETGEFNSESIFSSKHDSTKIHVYRSKCKECSETFSNSYQLRKHAIHAHNKKSEFVCSFCQKYFYDSYHLKRHVRSHTGERPYICSVCDKRFASTEHLKRHMNTHEKDEMT